MRHFCHVKASEARVSKHTFVLICLVTGETHQAKSTKTLSILK